MCESWNEGLWGPRLKGTQKMPDLRCRRWSRCMGIESRRFYRTPAVVLNSISRRSLG